MIDEIKCESWYQSFLTDKCQRSLKILQKSSIGSKGIEDLILEACANILGVPVILISSSQQRDIQIHLPIKNQILYTPLFVAHDVKEEMFYGTYSITEKLRIVGKAFYFLFFSFFSYEIFLINSFFAVKSIFQNCYLEVAFS